MSVGKSRLLASVLLEPEMRPPKAFSSWAKRMHKRQLVIMLQISIRGISGDKNIHYYTLN